MVKPLKHYANLHKNLVHVTSLTNRSYDNENTSSIIFMLLLILLIYSNLTKF